jgi:hypothetical protein
MPGPTAASEFRRGLDPYNLMVGAVAAGVLGVATLLATRAGLVPDLLRFGAGPQALATALGLFVIITGMHTATHTYFGWRFARGIRAAGAGQHARAVRLLAPVERPGMTHYDPGGHAQQTLDASRQPRAAGVS